MRISDWSSDVCSSDLGRRRILTEPRVPRLSVDIVSDVMCPWCIIGWLKFRKVIDHFAGRLDFRVQWHPFELNPDMPPEGEDAASHVMRSEEHTSELPSLIRTSYAVFCLKKKQMKTTK